MNGLNKSFAHSVILAACSAMSLLAQEPYAPSGQTIVNGRPLTQRQQVEFQLIYGTAPATGNFWYDARSGMWGLWKREVAGVLKPGHSYGPLSPDASNGNTGVFINGRQLNIVEVLFFQRLLGVPIRPGRAWLDGMTGNYGLEGSPIALGNVVSRRNSARRQPLYSGSELMGGFSNAGGTCTKAGNCFYPNR